MSSSGLWVGHTVDSLNLFALVHSQYILKLKRKKKEKKTKTMQRYSIFNLHSSTKSSQVKGSYIGFHWKSDQLYACARPHGDHLENMHSMCKKIQVLLTLYTGDTNKFEEVQWIDVIGCSACNYEMVPNISFWSAGSLWSLETNS